MVENDRKWVKMGAGSLRLSKTNAVRQKTRAGGFEHESAVQNRFKRVGVMKTSEMRVYGQRWAVSCNRAGNGRRRVLAVKGQSLSVMDACWGLKTREEG
jgi:hypothetical protein